VAGKDKRLRKLEKRTEELESRLDKLEKSLKKRKKRCHKKDAVEASHEAHHGKESKSAAHVECDHHGHGDKSVRGTKSTHKKPAGSGGGSSTRSTARTRKAAGGIDTPEPSAPAESDA